MLLCMILHSAKAQQAKTLTGKVFDAVSKEPIEGAVITDSKNKKAITDINGKFTITTQATQLTISSIGFTDKIIAIKENFLAISLQPANKQLQQVVVSANRTAEKRSEAPVAISVINKQTIEETKAQRLDALLNKTSGVFMVNLGNEQHEMSIRQPMTTSSRFLYMEDGIPLRTTGVYNHNALLEMNLPAAKSIEIIKGPSSALYGGEAIGGAVNVITQAAPAFTSGSISTQLNNTGYKRADAQLGTSLGKLGIIASGYIADKKDGPIEHSDFRKSAFTLRADYKFTNHLSWSNSVTYLDYYSDMTGALDSIKFAQRNFSSLQTFTYRTVYALRYKSILTQQWNNNSATSISLLYRDNSVIQNPSYSIASTASPTVYKGQINDNAFNTYALFIQHTQKFNWLNSKLIAGASVDYSPQTYYAKFIWINKDLSSGKYVSYISPTPDSLLSNYKTNISNTAAFADFEFSPVKGLRIVTALRYDAFKYNFQNSLTPSASSGAPSSVTTFNRVTPKIGFTYNKKGIGFYGNYSEGYVPPQITELFNSVKVPYLQPQTFFNYEIDGWLSLINNKLYADWSLYLMNGTNEIISVKQSDGSTVNQNAGKTQHYGIEYGLTYKPTEEWAIHVSATNAKHTYIDNLVKGVDYSGKEISGAPRFFSNAEVSFKPKAVKGLRLAAEWQHQSKYFMDDLNNYTYNGFNVVNFRVGYQLKSIELWVNVLNAFNEYYAVLATKSATSSGNSSYSYNMGDPREITFGIAYRFGKK
ncbi:MAG: TonB-dependent receptor [Chitinophaga sp.]|nr:TonB-dependent receptor [Chitinophaga sp.]